MGISIGRRSRRRGSVGRKLLVGFGSVVGVTAVLAAVTYNSIGSMVETEAAV